MLNDVKLYGDPGSTACRYAMWVLISGGVSAWAGWRHGGPDGGDGAQSGGRGVLLGKE